MSRVPRTAPRSRVKNYLSRGKRQFDLGHRWPRYNYYLPPREQPPPIWDHLGASRCHIGGSCTLGKGGSRSSSRCALRTGGQDQVEPKSVSQIKVYNAPGTKTKTLKPICSVKVSQNVCTHALFFVTHTRPLPTTSGPDLRREDITQREERDAVRRLHENDFCESQK